MEQFDRPKKEIWLQREAWIDNLIEESETGCYLVSVEARQAEAKKYGRLF